MVGENGCGDVGRDGARTRLEGAGLLLPLGRLRLKLADRLLELGDFERGGEDVDLDGHGKGQPVLLTGPPEPKIRREKIAQRT